MQRTPQTDRESTMAPCVAQLLENSLTQSGQSIPQLSTASPVLVVFLRHSGCIFCRETLGDIARSRSAIEKRGTRIVLVHMGDIASIERALGRYKLPTIDRICDPMQDLYRAFGLKSGKFLQLFGPRVLWRSLLTVARHGFGPVSADASQLPGAFLIAQCAVVRRFRHRTVADRPDYLALSTL